jgi:hypothetical protein
LEKLSYSKSMQKQRGRPPKPKGQRKDVDLRIPVTAEQKDLVMRAVRASGQDMASWARALLLHAAKRAVSRIEE